MTEMLPFPVSPFVQVKARVASIHADGPDGDTNPDWRAEVGEKITLTPSIGARVLVYDPTGPNPIIVTVSRVECVVDVDGWLTKPDGRRVFIAPTNDGLLSVTGWHWTATVKGATINFSAPSGGVVDLADFITAPAIDATKAWIERIPELIDAAGNLVSIESVIRDGDDMVITLSNGSVNRFPLPEGVPGPAPEIGWIGTSLVVDDQPPVDLKGAKGDDGDPGDPGQYSGIYASSGSYTLVAADVGRLVTVDGYVSPVVTVPSGVFSTGQRVDVLDIGPARVTFVNGAGMALDGTPSLVSRDQYSAHTVVFLSSTEAVVVGDLA